MQPSPAKRMKLQTGVARARMIFKQHLEWLPGFVFEDQSDVVERSGKDKFKWLFIGNDSQVKQKQFSRDDIRIAEMNVKKLVIRFPRALPKIVGDVDHWYGKISRLLGVLKAWVHEGKPPKLESMLDHRHASDRWRNQLLKSQRSFPKLKSLLVAVAFAELTGTAEPNVDSINWVVQNASPLELIAQAKHFKPQARVELQFKFWQMRNEMPVELLEILCRFLSNEPAFHCPTRNQFYVVDRYLEQIRAVCKKSGQQTTFPLAKKLTAPPTEPIGLIVLSVVNAAFRAKPKSRKSLLQILEPLLTLDAIVQASEIHQRIGADQKRLLRTLRQLQAGSRLLVTEIDKVELSEEIETCQQAIKPLCDSMDAFKSALELIQSDKLKRENWLVLLHRLPADIRCCVFKNWQRVNGSNRQAAADLDFFASQLGKIFAKREVPKTLEAHWRNFISQRHAEELVTNACENFAGNRRNHKTTIALLKRLVESEAAPISQQSYASLSGFAAASKDVDYLVDLVQAIGETELTFDEEDVSIAVGFGNSVEQTAEMLKTLGDSSEQWEYIEVLQRLTPLRQSPRLKLAITNLALKQQLAQLNKLSSLSLILSRFDSLQECIDQAKLEANSTAALVVPEWIQQYPTPLHASLKNLGDVTGEGGKVAETILGADFPTQSKLKRQIAPIEAKIADSQTDSDLRQRLTVRLENLRRYSKKRASVSDARLENLREKIEARVDREVIERYIKYASKLIAKGVKKQFDVGDLIDKLLSPPYEMAFPEILRLPKSEQNLGLRLLFETKGESTKCFELEPANLEFIQKLKDKSINPRPWLVSETWQEKTADGKPYNLFLTDQVIDYLLMGFHFQTCLTPGSVNFFSTLSNAVDINKKVLYGKTADGQIIGRCLFALNDHGEVVTFHRYQHEEASGFGDAVDRYAEHLAQQMGSDLSDDSNISSLVANRWYNDSAVPVQNLTDPESPLSKAVAAAGPDDRMKVLLANVEREKIIRRLPVFIGFVERYNCDQFPLAFSKEFCDDVDLNFRDRFQIAVHLYHSCVSASAKNQIIFRLIGMESARATIKLLKRHYCCDYCDGFGMLGRCEHVYGMLNGFNPTLALRSLRTFRSSRIKNDLDEPSKRIRKVLAKIHRKLGRLELAAKLELKPAKN